MGDAKQDICSKLMEEEEEEEAVDIVLANANQLSEVVPLVF